MKNTIKLNREFRRCYKKGKFAAVGSIVLYAVKNNRYNGYNRYGLTVSKKIGNAVLRNRAKRLMREAYRKTAEFQMTGYSLVIVARSSINVKNADAVTEDFTGALKKLELWKNEESIT